MKKLLYNILHPTIILIFGLGVSVSASLALAEDDVTPFIKAKYFNTNISLETFRENPREYFRSEAAFNRLVGYIESEIHQPITNREFIALMKGDQVRSRSCPVSETILVGGLLEDGNFHWFSRACRPGEEIVQLKVGEKWVDVFSLACLNALEDRAPVPEPVLATATTLATPVAEPEPRIESGKEEDCRFVKVEEKAMPSTFVGLQPAFTCDCFVPGVTAFVPGGTQSTSKYVCD